MERRQHYVALALVLMLVVGVAAICLAPYS